MAFSPRTRESLPLQTLLFISQEMCLRTSCALKTEQRNNLSLLTSSLRISSLPNCKSSPRLISIGQLHVLPRFHLRPINVIVYDVPYSFRMRDLILGGVSRLDAFSVYLVRT